MNNNTMNNIATAQQNLTQQINTLEKNHKKNHSEGLRLENGQFKLGPKYFWKTQFLKTIRPIISFIRPLVRIIDARLNEIDKINSFTYNEAANYIERIAFLGKSKIENRQVTITEAKQHILNGNMTSIAETNRVIPPYLNTVSPHHKGSRNKGDVRPELEEMLANVERDYSIEINSDIIEKKLKKEKISADQQSTKVNAKHKFEKTKVSTLTDNTEDNKVYSKTPNKGELKLSLPAIPEKKIPEHKCTLAYEFETKTNSGISHCQGVRPRMEDEHVAKKITFQTTKENGSCSIVGVFDGHSALKGGGDIAAKHISTKIPEYFKARLEEFNAKELTDTGIWNAIKIAFVDANNSYYEKKGTGLESGTTANVVISMPNGDLWVANCGDSRAMLIDPKGQTVQMSEDAKPSDEKYKKQIESRGSRVVMENSGLSGRVDNILAVARSLGDHAFYGAVTARPKITKFEMPKDGWKGYTLLQTCDGITDVFSTKKAGEIVHTSITEGDSEAVAAAKLVAAAYKCESGDNLTAIVTPLS